MYSIRLGKLLFLTMKIASPGIIHKTNAGGVKVNIIDEKEAKLAFSVFVFEKGLQVIDARMIL